MNAFEESAAAKGFLMNCMDTIDTIDLGSGDETQDPTEMDDFDDLDLEDLDGMELPDVPLFEISTYSQKPVAINQLECRPKPPQPKPVDEQM